MAIEMSFSRLYNRTDTKNVDLTEDTRLVESIALRVVFIFTGGKRMYKIVEKRRLNPSVTWMTIEAPLIARKAKAGQFIILRVDETGERIPLTVAGYDPDKGTVTIIFQKVGKTTMHLDELEVGDFIQDFVGPLGRPTELEGYQKVAVVGGGVGCAIAYPQAKSLHAEGVEVDVIAGFRSKDIVILEEEF